MDHIIKFVTKAVSFIRAKGIVNRQFKESHEDINCIFNDVFCTHIG